MGWWLCCAVLTDDQDIILGSMDPDGPMQKTRKLVVDKGAYFTNGFSGLEGKAAQNNASDIHKLSCQGPSTILNSEAQNTVQNCS